MYENTLTFVRSSPKSAKQYQVSGNVLLSNPSEEPFLEVASVQVTLTPLTRPNPAVAVKPLVGVATCPATNKKVLVGPTPGLLNCSYSVPVKDLGPYIVTAAAATPKGQRSDSKNAIQVNFAKAGQIGVGDCATVSESQSVDGPGKMAKANYMGKQAPPKLQKICRTTGFKVLQQLGSFEKIPCGKYMVSGRDLLRLGDPVGRYPGAGG